ncbi:MAG TPA: hypothetical protein VL418_16770 [Devosiaceae bacterium]|nr:hypothetical protein [Devosiaceae bacterium]
MKLPALLLFALAAWLLLLSGASVARHARGKAERVVHHLHWSAITGVQYPPKRPGK